MTGQEWTVQHTDQVAFTGYESPIRRSTYVPVDRLEKGDPSWYQLLWTRHYRATQYWSMKIKTPFARNRTNLVPAHGISRNAIVHFYEDVVERLVAQLVIAEDLLQEKTAMAGSLDRERANQQSQVQELQERLAAEERRSSALSWSLENAHLRAAEQPPPWEGMGG